MSDHVAGWCVIHDDQWPTGEACCFNAVDGRPCQWEPTEPDPMWVENEITKGSWRWQLKPTSSSAV